MKNKTFFILLIIIIGVFGLLFFFSCSQRQSTTPGQGVSDALKAPFDAKATIKQSGIEFVVDINKTQIGSAVITVIKPDSINGMQFLYNGEDVEVSYKGMSVKLNENSKAVSYAMPLVIKAIDAAASKNGVHLANKNGQLVLSGESDDKNFVVTLDKKTGAILNVSFPDIDLECRFDSFLQNKSS